LAILGEVAALRISLASPETIRDWSYGEVRKPETINYRTFKPERDGLFCERIFGPTKDWECHCGKYKKIKYKGIICDRCGVEVTRARVRRRRMGHIELAAPVCHIWYLKGVPSPIGLLLDISPKALEKVIYFASYIVTRVDSQRIAEHADDVRSVVEEQIAEDLEALEQWKIQRREQFEEWRVNPVGDPDALSGEELSPFQGLPADEAPEAEAGLADDATIALYERDLEETFAVEEDALQERVQQLRQSLQMLLELERKQLISEVEYRGLQRLVTVLSERLSADFSEVFRAGLGAAAVGELLAEIDLDELCRELRYEIANTNSGPRRARAIKRLAVADGFRRSRTRPEWMVMEAVPVLPPELRPMVQLDGGRFATSDVNDLYRRIINRNNRLRRIMDIKAPESIVNHEKRLLQEAVDALIDNQRRAHPVSGGQTRRPLKSLSDLLKGKEGRFRKNLLGKRVDYSGRSVIVVGPELKLNQCGLPREMALELFKPFVMKKLVEKGFTTNIKTAKRMVDRVRPEVWDALEEVIEDHPVMLNRAPTLHRLGIQAFEPVLVDGKAIQVHPLVCAAFNADFDGDQMAVHVPLSSYAQAEARILMMSTRNLFKPADGHPVVAPVYDIVLGSYYLTQTTEIEEHGETDAAVPGIKAFSSPEEAVAAWDAKRHDLHAPCRIRVERLEIEHDLDETLHADILTALSRICSEAHAGGEDDRPMSFTYRDGPISFAAGAALAAHDERNPEPEERQAEHAEIDRDEGESSPRSVSRWLDTEPANPDDGLAPFERTVRALEDAVALALRDGRIGARAKFTFGVRRRVIDTTIGRVIWNDLLPLDLRDYSRVYSKSALADLVEEMHDKHGPDRTIQFLDDAKAVGFEWATIAGISMSLSDMDIKTRRDEIIRVTEDNVRNLNLQFRRGALTQGERERLVREQWMRASEEVVKDIIQSIPKFNPIFMMVDSGSRGNPRQISQLSGMRGLMTDPHGRLIEDLPVRSSFHEGLTTLEYFVSTHGARKGLADTALRTADAGYLTRRLVDVAQDVIVRGEDCETSNGVMMTPVYEDDVYCRKCGEEDLSRGGSGTKFACRYCGAELLTDPSKSQDPILPLRRRTRGRYAAEPVIHPTTGEVLVEANQEITADLSATIEEAGVRQVTVRSPLTCDLRQGVCVKCYGRDLATWRQVEIGEAVGIIAAQSIGEPGTQLTMRTFHTGGVAASATITGVADVKKKQQEAIKQLHDDIDKGLVSLDTSGEQRENTRAIQAVLKVLEDPVGGLLRVVELFEARRPKGLAIVSMYDGLVADIDERGLRRVIIHSEQQLSGRAKLKGETLAGPARAEDGTVIAEEGVEITDKVLKLLRKHRVKAVTIRRSYMVPYRGYLKVQKNQQVRAGDRLTEGPLDPQQVLELRGVHACQDYLVKEIQRVYRSQNVMINDKHIEVIVRQMLRKRRVMDHGSTDLLPGQILDRFAFEEENRRVSALGGKPATAEVMLLGITEASLQTDSFLSAASFQKTTKVLTEAAIRGKSDGLRGLKENVIIGRLVPAGSGTATYRDTKVGLADPTQDIRIGDFDIGFMVDGGFDFDDEEHEEDIEEVEDLEAVLPGMSDSAVSGDSLSDSGPDDESVDDDEEELASAGVAIGPDLDIYAEDEEEGSDGEEATEGDEEADEDEAAE